MADEVTPLPPGSEPAFKAWLTANHVQDLDHPDSHYDYRGAFLAGVGRGADTGHFPDTFKQHGHPTFSVESKYSKGPGDGGSWNGDTYIPQAAAPAPSPQRPPLPGQSPFPSAPYGMSNGPVRLAGINDQPGQRFGGPAPEPINLDAPASPARGEPDSGWRVKDEKGNVLATFSADPVTTGEYQKKAIQKIGDALVSQAVSPEEHTAAGRALAYGLSLVGSMPTADIQKAIAARYDDDMGNSTKLALQGMRSARRGGGGGGGAAVNPNDPNAPTKENKFVAQKDLDAAKLTEGIVNNEATVKKAAALNDFESELNQMAATMGSGNPLGQRTALMEYMKTLSGKQSTDVERRQIANAGGIIERLQNDLSLWTEDPALSHKYVKQFQQHLQTLMGAVAARKRQFGEEMANRVLDQPYFKNLSPEDKIRNRNYAYGVATGERMHYGDPDAPAKTAAPATPAPRAGGYQRPDPDL